MDLQRIDRRISRALRLLEQHVHEPVDYGAVAAALDLSVHRFHHLFAEQMGESPGEYLRRIRLEAAATRLRWTRDSVGQVAAAVGYASQPSFTHAFARQYGISPARFRRDREQWPDQETDTVQDKRVKVVQSEALHCLARRYVGPPCDVPDNWADFLGALPKALSHPGQHLFVGLIHDDVRFTPPDRVRYDCCVTIESNIDVAEILADAPDLHHVTTEPGLFASIRHQGHYAAGTDPEQRRSVHRTYGYLLDEWMRESRHRFAARYAMEVYTVPHPRCAPEDLECIIHVPVTA
jgi:AraC family transcriptional regulator